MNFFNVKLIYKTLMKLLKKIKSLFSAAPVSPTSPSPEAQSISFLLKETAPYKAVLFIDNLVKSGSLFIREEAAEVYISTKLVYLYADKARWNSFLDAVGLWFSYTKSREMWSRRFIDAENEAIRATGKTPKELGEAELAKLKWDARQKVKLSDLSAPVQGKFNFLLVAEDDGSPVLVGSYQDGQVTVRNFDEVKDVLKL